MCAIYPTMSLRAQRGNLVADVLPLYITVMHDDNAQPLCIGDEIATSRPASGRLAPRNDIVC